MTGNLFNCEPNAPVAQGEVVDEVLQDLLNKIAEQNAAEQALVAASSCPKSARNRTDDPFTDLGHDYDLFRAEIMLDAINPADLSDTDWLAVISSCKSIGVPYYVVDAFNRRDSSRYDARENQRRWDSATDTRFNIETLHGIAKRFGYEEKKAQQEWFNAHPELSTPRTPDDGEDEMEQYLEGKWDLGNARRLEKFCGRFVRWLSDAEHWLVWSRQGVWLRASDNNAVLLPWCARFADKMKPFVQRLAKKFAAAEKLIAPDETGKHDHVTPKVKRRYQRAKTRLAIGEDILQDFSKANRINAAVTLLKGCDSILIRSDDLDTHDNLLNCLNGVVDLETGKLYPADPSLLITQQAKAAYRPDSHNHDIDKFLADILPDEGSRAALLRWLGYCLTGSVAEEKCFMIYGPGGNGKGTLTRLLTELFDAYATGLPVDAICAASKLKDAGAATPELNCLDNKRLAIVEELPRGRKLDVAKFKLLTGGDKIPARPLYQEMRLIDPHHKIMISGNFVPELTDANDDGLIRRIVKCDFTQSFIGSKCDPQLKQKLLVPDALNALLSRLVAEAQAWYKDGLIFSDAIRNTTRNYFASFDFLAEFLSEHCEHSEGSFVELVGFVKRLRETYPDETRCLSDRHLKDMVKKLDGKDGVHYKLHSRTRRACLYGIRFIVEDEWEGVPVDAKSIPDL